MVLLCSAVRVEGVITVKLIYSGVSTVTKAITRWSRFKKKIKPQKATDTFSQSDSFLHWTGVAICHDFFFFFLNLVQGQSLVWHCRTQHSSELALLLNGTEAAGALVIVSADSQRL